MPAVCFYFQVHQPLRLRRYSVFDTDRHYFDDHLNADILRKVTQKCYLPATKVLLDQIQKHDGKFRVTFSITGMALDQFEEGAPEVIDAFQKLAKTGCVEFLNETYYHSLAFLYSRDEFREQVDLHRAKIRELFGQDARVFRNTELIYNNDLAHVVGHMGYDGILTEGVDSLLGSRSPNVLYKPPHGSKIKVMLKNYRLSDDIAFRFSNKSWEQYPLTAEKFAGWVNQINGHGQVCNLFMDFETFGEHQWAETGILDFLAAMPGAILDASKENGFVTPSYVVDQFEPAGEMDCPHIISWADTERDLSAWLGNAMQSNALHELYKLEAPLKQKGDPQLMLDWRRLMSSDHFYYMSTKYWADGAVHKYFSPYESPYDSYINYMNVLDNVQTRLKDELPA